MQDLNSLVSQLGVSLLSPSTSVVNGKSSQVQDPLKVARSVTAADSVGAHAIAPQQATLSVAPRTEFARAAAPVQPAPANSDAGGGNSGSADSSDDAPESPSPMIANDSTGPQNSETGSAPAFDVQSMTASSIDAIDPQAQPNPQSLHVSTPASAQPESSTVTADSSVTTQIATLPTSAARVDLNAPESTSATAHAGTSETPLATTVRADRASDAVDSSPLLRAWNGGDNAQTHLVQSAQVAGNLRESQVNFALQADTLGNVEVHARVTGDVVGASIGVDRHDAHTIISSTLPTLHEALSERQLRVSEVSVFQNSQQQASSAPGDGRTSQQRDPGQQRAAANPWAAEQATPVPDVAGFAESSVSSSSFDSNGRLSVRA